MVDAPSAFYFALSSPEAYLCAERVLPAVGGAIEWIPVLARDLGPSAESWQAFRCQEDREIALMRIERLAAQRGLQPLRWPDPFPFDSDYAMRVATYAKQIGRTVAFALAAFRQAFAAGRARRRRQRADRRVGLRDASAGHRQERRDQGRRAGPRRRDRPCSPPRRARRAGDLDAGAGLPRRRRARGGRRGAARERMRGRHAYRIVHRRGGLAPAALDPERMDQVEIVSVDDGEVVLFWDLTALHARRVLKLMRVELVQMDARDFFERWASFEGEDDLA